MPSSTPRTARSRAENRRGPRRRVRRVVRRDTDQLAGVGGEECLLLPFDPVDQSVDVVRFVDEALDGLDHHRGGEVGPRVAVHELRYLLRARDQVHRLLLKRRVRGGVGVLADRDVVGVAREIHVLGLAGGQPGQQVPGTLHRAVVLQALGVLRQQESVDGRLDRVLAVRRVDLGEGEEVDVVLLVLGELLARVRESEDGHPALALLEGGRRLLPGTAVGALLAVREHAAPGVEDVLDAPVGPGFLTGHQRLVELVAVGAHVEVVEGAHRGPAVLVAERDRRQLVLLHPPGERQILVQGARRLVPVLREDALPVEDRPRVVVVRREVLLAVGAGRLGLERGGEAGVVAPEVADVVQQPLLCEELHPEAA